MVDQMLDVSTNTFDRSELAQFLPSHRLVVAFENFTSAVLQDVPGAVNANTAAIADTDSRVSNLETVAASARSSAQAATAALAQLTAYLMTRRDDAARLNAMQRQIDDLQTQLLGA